jgi:CDP-diacylglycerol--serine O-phosphatidyltransferase
MSKNKKGIFEYLGIPGTISMIGLGFSWLALILLLQNLPFLAITFAIVAFFLDYLDGFIARRMHKDSEFGKLLDSSSDVLNYLIFSALLFCIYIAPNPLGIFVGFIIIASGVFRLARFNVEGFDVKNNQLYYSGIIVCFTSLTAIVLFFIQQFYPQIISIFAVPIMIIISLLQITRIPLKKTNTYGFWLILALLLLIISLGFQLWKK